jgi:acyl-CoA thioesterase-1
MVFPEARSMFAICVRSWSSTDGIPCLLRVSVIPSGPVDEDVAMRALRYVALGDSYTIGTSVAQDERWPDQLVRRLADGSGGRDRGPGLELVANLGANGFTSRDVISHELPRVAGMRPEFISLLAGVNDVVQGVPLDTYAANVERILDTLLTLVPANRIVAVATPDYTVTPQGAAFGAPDRQAARIAAVNARMAALAGARGIAFVDITDLSIRAATDRTLVASDGLHPSGTQYALWVDRIEPVVRALLAD